jgi:hypothetical protein
MLANLNLAIGGVSGLLSLGKQGRLRDKELTAVVDSCKLLCSYVVRPKPGHTSRIATHRGALPLCVYFKTLLSFCSAPFELFGVDK